MNSARIETTISASQLKVSYDRRVALEADHLQVRGNVLAIVGHNGAGKSTLIKTILELLQPQSGSLTTGASLQGEPAQILLPEKHMAFCPETGAVFADISVESYIQFWCQVKQNDRQYYTKQGQQILEQLHIAPLLPKLGRELSKGQRRRVQTAIGFLTSPKLFLFDEPFDGLDVQKTSELADVISEHRHDTSFIISSHRMDVVERLADSIIVLKEGRFFSTGSTEDVCRELCAETILIRNLSQLDATFERLQKQLPHSILTRIGQEIAVSGNSLNDGAARALFGELEAAGAHIDSTRPSLTDAMSFHLRSIAFSDGVYT